jgi:nucleoid-associated protein EbfC
VSAVEPGGQLDMQQLFAAAAQMQSQLMNAQQQLAETEIEGTAGGGMVRVTVNGQGEVVDVNIAAEAIDPGDPAETAQTLADLVLAACRAAYDAIADVQEQMMGPLASGLGGDFGGLAGIPGLPVQPGAPGQAPAQPRQPSAQPGQLIQPGQPTQSGNQATHDQADDEQPGANGS